MGLPNSLFNFVLSFPCTIVRKDEQIRCLYCHFWTQMNPKLTCFFVYILSRVFTAYVINSVGLLAFYPVRIVDSWLISCIIGPSSPITSNSSSSCSSTLTSVCAGGVEIFEERQSAAAREGHGGRAGALGWRERVGKLQASVVSCGEKKGEWGIRMRKWGMKIRKKAGFSSNIGRVNFFTSYINTIRK